MRTDTPAPTDTTLASRSLEVTLYRNGTPRDLVVGTTGLNTLSLSGLVAGGRQSDVEATIDLRYDRELLGANRPKPGQLVQIRQGTVPLFNGVVAAIQGERETRGERAMSLVVRKRDATPLWRDLHRVSPLFSIGTDLGYMARTVATTLLGLADEEHRLGGIGLTLVHDTAQFGDVSAWEMLSTIFLAGLLEPYVDVTGVLRTISRDIRRAPDLTLSYAQVQEMSTSGSQSPPTALRVRWLDPALSKVYQTHQVIASISLQCGFFRPKAREDVWWSKDRRQRAENVVLEIKQSVNDGLLPVGDEWFEQTSEFGGIVRVKLGPWVPVIGLASLVGLLAASKIPDGVQVGISGTGITISVGRVAQQIAGNALMLALMSLGVGVYDLKGTPFDYVHAINDTVAYDKHALAHAERSTTIENHLVPDESTAQAMAIGELFYAARRATNPGRVVIADDWRIERGDILGLPDGRRFYALGHSRSLKRGDAALLEVSGFYV